MSTPDTDRLAALVRESWESMSNGANPPKGDCECGMPMDAHAGGWALLHHDGYMADGIAARLIAAGVGFRDERHFHDGRSHDGCLCACCLTAKVLEQAIRAAEPFRTAIAAAKEASDG